MRLPSEVSAAERARWLAELSVALSEARRLVRDLGASEGRFEALELYAQIEAIRLEVESLRLRKGGRSEPTMDPEWTNPPWQMDPARGSGDQVPAGSSPPPENGSRKGSSDGGFQPDVATNARLRKARLP